MTGRALTSAPTHRRGRSITNARRDVPTVDRLPNGATVATLPLAGFTTAYVGAFLRVGSRFEPANLNGISHFLEHMAFKGTARRDTYALAHEAESVGGEMNAFTAKDHTAYYLTLPGEAAATAVDLVADVVRHSTFPRDELERERNVILQEMVEVANDPQDRVHDLLDAVAFPRQPLGRPILGRRDVIRTIKRGDFSRYLAAGYTASNLVVVGTGAVDHASFRRLASRRFGSMPRGRRNEWSPAVYRGGHRHLDDDFGQTCVAVAWPMPGRADPRYPVYALLAELAGGGMASPLFQSLRDRHGLAYSVSCYVDVFAECGLFQIVATVAPRDVGKCIDGICRELALLAAHIAPRDLERARTLLRTHYRRELERPAVIAERIGIDLVLGGRTIPVEDVVARIDATTASELRGALKAMVAEPPSLAIAGRAAKRAGYERLRKGLAAI